MSGNNKVINSSAAFADLGLSPLFLRPLEKRNITSPTEIQKQVIPKLLKGESFIFQSATGTGKTFAYLLPILEKIAGLLEEGREKKGEAGSVKSAPRGKPLFLIAAPTFELCSQIKNEADFLIKGVSETTASPVLIRTALLIGSAAVGRQIETLKKERPELVVGNPGRILALSRLGKLKLDNIRFLVLDEGDRLVADELFDETSEMVSLLGPPARTISGEEGSEGWILRAACSATIPAKSRRRLNALFGLPEAAGIDDDSARVLREKIEHWAFFSHERDKADLLRSLIAALRNAGPVKALIFCGRGAQVESITARLMARKLPVAGLWGGMEKTGRRQALDAFRSGKLPFLVTSDLAARGLDVPDISHVIALDVSEDRDVYIHRAGRTARAGKGGVMISIGGEGEMRRLAALEKNLGLTVYPKELYGGKILAPGE